jgi:hypothetical protein
MDQRLLRKAALAILALASGGCGGLSSKSVEGTVTLDGAPLKGAHVSIAPKDPNAAKDKKLQGPFVGDTDDQGHFALGPVGKAGGGAPAGAYTLGITTKIGTGDETAKPPVERVPAPHSSTGVDFEVPAGGVTDAKFDLISKAPKKKK